MKSLIWTFEEIIYMGAAASILVIIILLIKKIFSKILTPKWHYYIWVLLIIRLLVPFYPQSFMSIYNLFYSAGEKINLPRYVMNVHFNENSVYSQKITNDKNKNSPQNTGTISTENIDNSNKPSVSDKIASQRAKGSIKYNSIITIGAIIWITGVVLLSLYTVYINIIFAIKVNKKYSVLKDGRINGILENCKNTMNIKRSIRLFNSRKIRTPSLYGFFNSKILISAVYMDKLTNDEIKYVFLHELSHYKRKDIAVNWIVAILQIVYFFNPLIWYAFHKMHEDCEISCDAAALKYVRKSEYQDYGSTIIKLVKIYSESNFIPVTAGICKNKSSYKRRIIMISKFKKNKWTNTAAALVLITFTGLIGLTGCSLSANKGLDSKTTALSGTTVSAKITPTTSNTDDSTSSDGLITSGSSEIYKSTKFNLSITFPANWSGKYRVKETDEGLFVYFAPKQKIPDGQGLYFCILKKTKDLIEDGYDSIDGKKEINVDGISYFLGGPTDVNLSEDNPEFSTFVKLQTQIPDIINSIKKIGDSNKSNETPPKSSVNSSQQKPSSSNGNVKDNVNSQQSITEKTKNYIINGQEGKSEAQKIKWSKTFLDQVDIESLYKKYISNGGNADNLESFASYITLNAPISSNWQELFKKDLYDTYGEKAVKLEHLENDIYQAYVVKDGKEVPYVAVSSRTGYFHG